MGGHALRDFTQRLRTEETGFTLLELLNVLIILSILMTIVIPTYLQFKDNARKTTARANVKLAVKAANSYSLDNFVGSTNDPNASTTDNGYAGLTVAGLKKYDANIAQYVYVNNSGEAEPVGVTVRAPLDATHFCIYSWLGGWYAYQLNPSGKIKTTLTPAAVCT